MGLHNILSKALAFNKQQLEEYQEKIEQISSSTTNLANKISEFEARKTQLEVEIEEKLHTNHSIEKQISEVIEKIKECKYEKDENKVLVEEYLQKIREHVQAYYNIAERCELQTRDKIEVVKNLNHARRLLQEDMGRDNLSEVSKSMTEFGSDNEEEPYRESLDLEEKFLSA